MNESVTIKIDDTQKSFFECSKGGTHEFDQFDYDGGTEEEYGHCIKCGQWISTYNGRNETLYFEQKQRDELDL